MSGGGAVERGQLVGDGHASPEAVGVPSNRPSADPIPPAAGEPPRCPCYLGMGRLLCYGPTKRKTSIFRF